MVEVEGSPPHTRRIVGGGSYLSASSRDVVVGLGSAASCEVTIHWPAGGAPERLELRAGTRVTLREDTGSSRVQPLEAR